MYYVFFETGNVPFLENNIAAKFCTFTVQYIIALYKSGAFTGKGGKLLDNEDMKTVLRKNAKPLFFLNCQELKSTPCANAGCEDGHKAVIARNQSRTIEQIMKNKKDPYTKVDASNARDRLNLQVVFQNYETVNNNQLEVIHIEDKRDHAEYLRSYVKHTDKLKDKSDADGFVYVRATTGVSDYADFSTATSLPNLTPCDLY